MRDWQKGLILIALSLSGCKSRDQGSDPQGHFENFSAEELELSRGQQRIPAEESRAQAVIVASSLVSSSYGDFGFLEAVLDAGAELWVVYPKRAGRYQLETLGELVHIFRNPKRDLRAIRLIEAGSGLQWTRDFGPIGAITGDGYLRLIDLNSPLTGRGEGDIDDDIPLVLANLLGLKRISLPFYHEGGDFMTNSSGTCIITERACLLEQILTNKKFGDEYKPIETIADYYEQYGGCRRVISQPNMPFEDTGHNDIWAKFLNDRTLAVGAISDEVLNALDGALQSASANAKVEDVERGKLYRARVAKVKKFLDERATALADLLKHQVDVVRLPMPLPVIVADPTLLPGESPCTPTRQLRWKEAATEQRVKEDRDLRYPLAKNVFYSYVNMLRLNDVAIVPDYSFPSPHGDQEELAQGAWRGLLREDPRAFAWAVNRINGRFAERDQSTIVTTLAASGVAKVQFDRVYSYRTVKNGGAAHCITMQVPRGFLCESPRKGDSQACCLARAELDKLQQLDKLVFAPTPLQTSDGRNASEPPRDAARFISKALLAERRSSLARELDEMRIAVEQKCDAASGKEGSVQPQK